MEEVAEGEMNKNQKHQKARGSATPVRGGQKSKEIASSVPTLAMHGRIAAIVVMAAALVEVATDKLHYLS